MYKSNVKLNGININRTLTKYPYKYVYSKSQIINLQMFMNLSFIYNGKYFFKKYIKLWALGYNFGNFIWTKKRAKYKSKLKLKVKLKLIAQKQKQKRLKSIKSTHTKLLKRYVKIIVPPKMLKSVKNKN